MNRSTRDRRAGYSVLEMLIIVAIVGIMAAVIIPTTGANVVEQLESAASQVASDVAYARNLAVTNGSSYRLTFDTSENEYVLQHVGTNTALNTLPKSPLRLASDPANQQTTLLSTLVPGGIAVRLHAVYALSTPATSVTTIEFGPLGETTRIEETIVWLAAGSGNAARYISVRVNPVTGIGRVGQFGAQAPSVSTPTG